MGLDPVKQRLVNHPQRGRYCRDALVILHQPDCPLLEFERVTRLWCFCHLRFSYLN